MTRAVFSVGEKGFTGFLIRGHAGDRQSARNDAVCASISSMAYLTANTVTDFFGDGAQVQISDGYFRLQLKDGFGASSSALLQSFAIHLTQLSRQYPEKLKVKIIKTSSISEVRNNA
ncbi:MAG: ribosomal-processing cysteine protease Prp [Clostridia bacterium]|nr:ribosomal-processing cysteine protease Prp [Clostridia bacterium]